METGTVKKNETRPIWKNRSLWSRIVWALVAVCFALAGARQLTEGIAVGDDGFPVDRRSEPALFWLFTSAYFALAAWILVVSWKSISTRNKD